MLVVLVLLSGCATVDEPAAPAAEVDEPAPGMRLRVVDAQGEPAPTATDKREVFIGLFGTVTAADIVDTDYAFVVVDPQGAVLSLDDPSCRQFHVDASGQLAMIDSPCRHAAGASTLQLMPFADTDVDGAGTMHFIVQIAPAETSFDACSLKATFSVAAWPSS